MAAGIGELLTARGAKITGPFHDGAAHGICKVIERNGDVYEGGMVGGVRETRAGVKAVLSMVSGDIYEGGFEDGEFYGRGTYACLREGTIFDGYFQGAHTQCPPPSVHSHSMPLTAVHCVCAAGTRDAKAARSYGGAARGGGEGGGGGVEGRAEC